MRSVSSALLALALLTLPIAAQQGGGANRTSPTLGQSITFTSGCSVEIKYRAITWAQGRFMDSLKTPAGRESANKNLKSNPTGSLTTSHDVTLGGTAVKAGSYKLYFAVDDDQKFHLVLANEAGNETKWKLDLAEKEDHTDRLSLTLTAGKAATDANLGVSFGKMACTVGLSSASAAQKEPAKKEPAKTEPAKTESAAGHGK